MIFTQTLNTDTRRDWLSDCTYYRISYYNTLPQCNDLPASQRYRPGYYALVKQVTGEGRPVWSFAHKRGCYWSFKAAEKGCRSNRFWWRRLLKAKSAEQARHLIAQSCVGRGHQVGRILSYPPAWCQLPKRLVRVLPGVGPIRRRAKVLSSS